jgi:hypothetical protein
MKVVYRLWVEMHICWMTEQTRDPWEGYVDLYERRTHRLEYPLLYLFPLKLLGP